MCDCFFDLNKLSKLLLKKKKTMCKAQCDKNNNRRLLDQN